MTTSYNTAEGDIVNNLPKLIGKGYKDFWNCKKRYRALKGGRGSKKSTTAAFWFPYNMMKYFHKYGVKPHTLVIRRFYNTHKDSTYAQILWAINKMGVRHLWKATTSPLQLVYIPSGQKILFRGLDDPMSITSITVEDGELCWTWWEEAFQCSNEDDFNKIDLSIRGELPEHLFKQHTLTFNAWSEKIWLKKRFFDIVGPDGINEEENVMAITKNFDCNEFLGEDDLQIFKQMKINNPRRYSIEGEGNWGIAEGLIYDNWEEREFDINRLRYKVDNYGKPIYRELNGLDFGYSVSPTAFIALLADRKKKEIYIYDEIYKSKLTNKQIYDQIKYKGHARSKIAADSEDPRTINELRVLGLSRIFKAKKGPGSVDAGIQKLQDYKIIVHPRCINTIIELSNYVWDTDSKTGVFTGKPIKDYDHLMDAMRYATEKLTIDTFTF